MSVEDGLFAEVTLVGVHAGSSADQHRLDVSVCRVKSDHNLGQRHFFSPQFIERV